MKKKIFFIILLVFLALIVFIYLWLSESTLFSRKASAAQQNFSPENSYVFVTPLKALANNQEQIRVTVFILNNQGLGVSGKAINLVNQPGLNIQAVQAVSDSYGKAVFDVSASQKGDYYLEVDVGMIKLNQKAHLTFD